MFFWFNAAFIIAIAAGNVLFDEYGGHWVILPIFFIAGFATHVVTFHLYWTIRKSTYSPGLLSSLLYLVVFYLLIKYGLTGNRVSGKDFAIGTVAGIATLGVFLTVGPTIIFPRLTRHRHQVQNP